MKKTLHFIVFLSLLSSLSLRAQPTKIPASQVSVQPTNWTYLPSTNTSLQVLLDWFDGDPEPPASTFIVDTNSLDWIRGGPTASVQSVVEWLDATGPFLPGERIEGASYNTNARTWNLSASYVENRELASLSNAVWGVFITKAELTNFLSSFAGLVFPSVTNVPDGGSVNPTSSVPSGSITSTAYAVFNSAGLAGSTASYVVPGQTGLIEIVMWGGAGGGIGGGPGGYSYGQLVVTEAASPSVGHVNPGTVLTVQVGGSGSSATPPIGGGRASLGNYYTGGGGRSAVLAGGVPLIVAGGGGGGGGSLTPAGVLSPYVMALGGGGGGELGWNGTNFFLVYFPGFTAEGKTEPAFWASVLSSSRSGFGGTQNSPGAGWADGSVHSGFHGLSGTDSTGGLQRVYLNTFVHGAGAGGGGYFGGGAGGWGSYTGTESLQFYFGGGGGGGSGFTGGVLNGVTLATDSEANFTGWKSSPPPAPRAFVPPQTSHGRYTPPAGQSHGSSSPTAESSPGLVVISFTPR